MKLSELEGKRILILGFSKEGQVTLGFLKKHKPHLDITVADASECTPQQGQLLQKEGVVSTFFGVGYLESLQYVDIVFKTPGISSLVPEILQAKTKGVVITSATNLFFAERKGKIISVTGSKGKSTTTSLVYAMLSEHGLDVELVGNIGKPVLEYLDRDHEEKWYVCELSSYQLEDLRYVPDIFMMVSFFPDHLDYHGGLDAYFMAKVQITTHMNEQGIVVYNKSFKRMDTFFAQTDARKIPYNDGFQSKVQGKRLFVAPGCEVDMSSSSLQGEHNAENALGACTIAHLFGVKKEVMEKVLSTFQPLPHRLQPVGTYKDIAFVDDAISTTPESTIAGMNSITDQIGCMILGGKDRGYDFLGLAHNVIERKVACILLFPDSGQRIYEALERVAAEQNQPMPKCLHVQDMESCIRAVYRYCPKNTYCVLSCASPSYSIFKNFEEKGNLFQTWVKQLGVE